jgi:hypothetical protein
MINRSLQVYEIFHGDIAQFERPEAQKELQDHIRGACLLSEPDVVLSGDAREMLGSALH